MSNQMYPCLWFDGKPEKRRTIIVQYLKTQDYCGKPIGGKL
jgi:hypothetical protein